jgi:hypothetical protein
MSPALSRRPTGSESDDRELLIHAAAQAQHAADYILSRNPFA